MATIKGITVQIGAETTGLKAALKDVENESSKLRSELKGIERQLKFDPHNVELWAQKQKVLNDQVEATREKLNRLKDVQAQVNQQFQEGKISEEQYRAFQREIAKTESQLKDYEKQLRAVNLQNHEFNQRMQEMGKKLQDVGKQLTDVGKTLSTRLTAPLTALGAVSAKTAIDFESAFAGVRKTVDASEAEFAALAEGIREMAKEIPAAATEIAGVAEAAGQLGIANEHILSFTRTMIDLGEATNMSAEEAATALARLANITQMPQSEFDRLGSTIVALGNNLATTEAEIVEMGLRLAGAGKQVGMTEAQILSLAGALSSVGIEAEAGGSAISRLMVNMQLAVETGGEALLDFASVAGMTADGFRQAFQEDAAGALTAFIRGLQSAEDQGTSAIKVLDDMGITEIRLRDALLRAAGAGDLLAESIQLGTQAWEENTALTNEAAQRYETTASKLEIMRNRLQDVAITFGEILLPPLVAVAEKVGEFADWLANLDPSIQRIIVTIGALAAAIGPLVVVVGTIVSSAGKLAGLVGNLVPLIGSLNPVVLAAVGAVAALGVAIASTNRDMAAYYDKVLETTEASRDQADALERLVEEYKELSGKPDKSEEEHRRLEQVMKDIIAIQPDIAKGYDTIDEAIQRNIGTLETYIDTLRTQTETQLMQAELEFLRRKNTLEEERNDLIQKRAELQERLTPEQTQAMEMAHQVAELENVFIRWQKAIRDGFQELAKELEQEMQRIFKELDPEFFAQPEAHFEHWPDMYGWYVDWFKMELGRITDLSGFMVDEIEKVEKRIAEIDEELGKGKAISKALEDLRASITKTGKDVENAVSQTTTAVEQAVGEQTGAVVSGAEEQTDERTKFEEQWNRKLFELTASRLELLDAEMAEALAKAEELEADKTAILEYYSIKRQEILNEEIEREREAEQRRLDALAKFEEDWARKLFEATADRLEILEREKQEALAKAEELGADKTAIIEYYALRQQEILDQQQAEREAARERELAAERELQAKREQQLQQWEERLFRQTASEIEILEAARDKELQLAEELGIDKTAILEYYENERQKILERQRAAEEKAAEEAARKELEALEARERARILFEDDWTQKLFRATADRLEILEREKQEALAKAEELGADKTAILEYYALQQQRILDEQARATQEAAEREAQALAAFEEAWTRKLFEQSATRLELLQRDRDEAIRKAEEIGADTTAIREYYANEERRILDELEAERDAARERELKAEQDAQRERERLLRQWEKRLFEQTASELEILEARMQEELRLAEEHGLETLAILEYYENERQKILERQRAAEEQAAEEAAKREAEALEARERARLEFEERWARRLFELQADELERLEREKEEAVRQAEEIGADTTAVLEYYAEKELEIRQRRAEEAQKIAEAEAEAERKRIEDLERARLEFEQSWEDRLFKLTASREELLLREREQALAKAAELGADVNKILEYYARRQAELAEEIANEQKTAWEKAFDAVESPLDRFVSAVSDAAGSLVRAARDIRTGDWRSAVLSILTETQSFAKAMELIGSVMQPVVVLFDAVLKPIINGLLNLWNGIMDALASISIFGWKPFEKLKDKKVGLVGESDKGGGDDKGRGGRQVSEITGPTRDLLVDLLTPLANLSQLVSPVQDIRDLLYERLPNFNQMEFAGAGVGAMGPAVIIENLNVTAPTTGVDDISRATIDQIERALAGRIQFGIRGRGGR